MHVIFRCSMGLAMFFATGGANAEDRLPLPCPGSGIKIGEVTQTSAVVWTRTTNMRNAGRPGELAIEWWPAGAESNVKKSTDWQATDPEGDFTYQFRLDDLSPGTRYELRLRSRALDGRPSATLAGRFSTAPARESLADIRFTVVTGQDYHRRDDAERGHKIYKSMLAVQPDFFVHTGDVLYYDRAKPFAKDVATARLKWNRMYSLPYQRNFHNQVPCYFMKDDHDILKNDCWPGQTYGDLTWEQGLALFREQTPSPPVPYRTVRWGKDLQIWLLEGREFRSPNTDADGPNKTILGAKQLAWLEQTLSESDATFKIVISATPIVGPDRKGKSDNHCNQGFKYEGDLLRKRLASHSNLYTVCGDRHWQYVSLDPVTRLREYSCGPTTDKHAGGWSDDKLDPKMHQFLRVKGGFLSVAVTHAGGSPKLHFRHHSVTGKVVHQETVVPQKAGLESE